MKIQTPSKKPQAHAVLHQYMAVIAAALPFAGAGSAIAWPSPTLPKMLLHETPIYLDDSQISWMVSLLYLGNLSSPIPAGYLADKFGRKRSLLYFGLVLILSWLLILFGTSPMYLYIARFLAGLHFGYFTTIQPIYIGEVSQPNIRGALSALNNFMFGIGNLITYLVGPFVSYYTLVMVSLILPVLFLLTFPFMPESPYYSFMKDNAEEARESLSWLRGNPSSVDLETELNHIKKAVQAQTERPGTYKDIISTKAARKAVIICIFFSAIKRLTGAGVMQAYATLTLPAKTYGVLNPSDCVIIVGVLTVLSSLLAAIVADLFNRKVLIYVSCLGCSLSMFIVAVWFFLNTNTSLDVSCCSFIIFTGYIVQTIAYNLACGRMGATYKGELFSAHVKTKSSAISTMSQAITSFLLNNLFLTIANSVGMYMNYLIYGLSCLIGIFFTYCYVPETKGKTLHEIQGILGGVKPNKVTTPAA